MTRWPYYAAFSKLARRTKPQVFRIYSYGTEPNEVPPELLEVSNFEKVSEVFPLPDPAMIRRDSVHLVACTLLMSAKLYSGGLDRGWFTHVFIDEAGHAEEPLCLAPLSLLCLPKQTQVVLAGDPQQLGPTILSPHAKQHGLQVSLLERLMRAPPYKRLDELHEHFSPFAEQHYNPCFITKLVRNYRSHPEILRGTCLRCYYYLHRCLAWQSVCGDQIPAFALPSQFRTGCSTTMSWRPAATPH